MIKIDLPRIVPEGLLGGPFLVQQYCAEHDAAPDLYATPKGKFEFNPAMYGCETVRSALKGAQFRKCCYCESKIVHIGAGEVEHYRPKAAWKQERKGKVGRPGYHWLAYTWDNLLWSCKACNGMNKGNLFPLGDPDGRDCCGRSLAAEQPLIVNPASMDPRVHITFELEIAKPQTAEGEHTIAVLGLNRPDLCEERRGVLERIQAQWHLMVQARKMGPAEMEREEIIRAKRGVERAVLPHAPYSSMAIDLISHLSERASLIIDDGTAN